MAYVLEGMKSLYNIKSYRMKVSSDEMEFEGDFLFGMITNSKSVAGFKGLVKGDVQFDDGVYEATFIKRPKITVWQLSGYQRSVEIPGPCIIRTQDANSPSTFNNSLLPR